MNLRIGLLIFLAQQSLWAGDLDFLKEEALLNAVIDKNGQEIAKCLNEGANPSKIFGWGTSSLHYAAMDGLAPDIFILLVKKAENINLKNSTEMTPLYHAVNSGPESLVRILMENGAVIDEKTLDAAKNKPNLLEILMSRRAKLT